MHTVNNVVRWSAYMSGVSASLILSGIIAGWVGLQALVFLANHY